jgi:hypothetical protein
MRVLNKSSLTLPLMEKDRGGTAIGVSPGVLYYELVDPQDFVDRAARGIADA